MNTANKKISVYVDTPHWYIRPKNTDWKYTLSLKGMADYSSLTMNYSRETSLVVEESLYWVRGKLFKISKPLYQRSLDPSVYAWCAPDVIYSHGKFPLTKANVPVVWLNGVVDPVMRIRSGASAATIEGQYRSMLPTFERAAVVLCPTKALANRHREKFPALSTKFQYAPFFLSHIETVTDVECFEKHECDEEVGFLFVGRDANRKGLDVVLEAFEKYRIITNKKIRLTIVTSDPAIRKKYGHLDGTVWHGNLHSVEIIGLMRQAHVFIMPSRFESYGLVYIEAMASGCAVIAASWESQVEIFDQGKSGMLSSAKAEDLVLAMSAMCDRAVRQEMALNGLRKCRREYTPEAVSKLHHEIFASTL